MDFRVIQLWSAFWVSAFAGDLLLSDDVQVRRRVQHFVDGFGRVEVDETKSTRGSGRVPHHDGVFDAAEGAKVKAEVVGGDVVGQRADEDLRRGCGREDAVVVVVVIVVVVVV